MTDLLKNITCKWPYRHFAALLVMALATILLTIGYMVTPILFMQLPVKQAADIAGDLFGWGSLIVLCAIFLLITTYYIFDKSVKRVKSLLFCFVLVATLRFWIAPWMAEIKALYPLGVNKNSIDWPLFASLHGLYQILYLSVICLLLYWSIKSVCKVHVSSSVNE